MCTPGSKPTWTDITSAQIAKLGMQSYPGGTSGTIVDRLTGDVVVHFVGLGIWKSADFGGTWARIDNKTVDEGGGRCENGWGLQVDQDDPTRMAVFTLDGPAAYTADGKTWKQWTHAPWGRNWDYGSVDWSSPTALTIIGAEHEKGSQVVTLSTDGGTTWTELTTFDVSSAAASIAMVGAINATTLIGSKGSGIVRSTDTGKTWKSVSTENPLSHVPVRFKNKFYLTTEKGLLVSDDDGATWAVQGTAIPGQLMYLGPYFGADEKSLVVGTNSMKDAYNGTSTIYKSTDAGSSWVKITEVMSMHVDYPIDFAWFGGFSWDPVNDLFYTTAMSNPAFRFGCTK
jgi:photosystem II stability/assembly factor-like uncharacterized protein